MRLQVLSGKLVVEHLHVQGRGRIDDGPHYKQESQSCSPSFPAEDGLLI